MIVVDYYYKSDAELEGNSTHLNKVSSFNISNSFKITYMYLYLTQDSITARVEAPNPMIKADKHKSTLSVCNVRLN